MKVWPTPAWQKGIADFLAGEDDSNPSVDTDGVTSTSAGPLSQSSSDSAGVSSQTSSSAEPHTSQVHPQAKTDEENEEEDSVQRPSDDED